MKFWILILAVSLECILHTSCFKLIDSDLINDHFVQFKKTSDNFANKQIDLFDLENDESYVRTMAAIAQAAAISKASNSNNDYQFDPSEVNSDEVADLDDSRYDEDEIKADQRDEETESHSSLGSGHQYVSGKFRDW